MVWQRLFAQCGVCDIRIMRITHRVVEHARLGTTMELWCILFGTRLR